MATIDDLQVQITADVADLNRKLNVVDKQMSDLSNNVSRASSKMSTGFIAFGSAVGNIAANIISKAFNTISSSVGDAVTRLDTLNNFPKVMSNLGISAKASQPAIDYMTEKLNGLPTAVDAAALAVQRFTSANGNIQASTEMFLALNNAVLAGGAGADIQRSALEQLSQAYAKGKPDMMEWRTMMMAMPAQLKQIATAMGYADASALGEALRSGEVSMNQFMATITQLNKQGVAGFKSFEEQARGATGGVATSITNLKTAITRGIANIMDAIGQSNIAGFFNMVASAVGTAANYVAAFVRVVLTAVNALRALFGQSAIQFGKTSSSADDAASSVSNIGSAANDATGALGGTGKAAKKLQQQLAGFDEMNVLKEQDASSGGGGGGGGAGGADLSNFDFGDFDFDTSKFGKATDKIQELAENMMKGLKKIFNFDKIGKAIKRFCDDIKKFMEPAGKIVKDVWEKYMLPFISWAGNDLFPAFLNALGGAINFIGQVLGKVWDNFLRPFIDDFVVPIAQFTGGIIVAVLNGIGDALRGIASNSTAMDAIAAGIVTLGSVLAAAMLAPKIIAIGTAITGLITTFSGFLAASGSVSVALMNTAAASTGATAALGGFGAGLQNLVSAVCSPVGIAILGVVAAITAVVTAVEFFKLKQMEADAQTKTYLTTEQWATEVSQNRKNAVDWEKESMDALANAISGVNSANLDCVNAEENLRTATTNLETAAKANNMTTEDAIKWFNGLKGNMSNLDAEHLKLAKTVASYTTAQDRSTEASKKYADAQSKVTSEQESLSDAQSIELRALLDEQAAVYANKKDWEGLAKMLQETASKEYEFVDSQGNTVKKSKDEMAWLTKGVADDVAKAHKEWDDVWKKFPVSVNDVEKDMANTFGKIKTSCSNNGKTSGQNFGNGVTSGIQSKNNAVYNAGYQQGLQGKKGFDAALRIHSPSREMMKQAGFFSEGIAIGILDNADMVENAAREVAAAANTSFSDFLDPVGVDVASKFADLNGDIETSLSDVIEANAQTHITVKVGEDTLIDKVVEGINASSFLSNRGVINI